MNAQYTSVGNANRARRCLASLEHSRLMALRHDLMRDGDMQLRVHIDRIMTAKQRAVLCKCSVHELLSGLVRALPVCRAGMLVYQHTSADALRDTAS